MCCVLNIDTPNRPEKRAFRGTGFVPCPACAMLDPDVLHATIQANRNPALAAFPVCRWRNKP